MNQTTFRIMMVMMLKNNWKAEIINIETAFSYGDLEEQINKKIPQELDKYNDTMKTMQ